MRTLITTSLFLLTIALNAAAQDNGVLHVETRLVELDVVVRDGHGPVADLKKEDFTVLDEGKAKRIDVFSVVTPATPRQTLAPLSPGTVSNRLPNAEGGTPPNSTVILFDRLNTPLNAWPYGNKQLIDYLRTMRPHDRIALYVLSNELRIVHDFTDSTERLIQAVSQTNIGLNPLDRRPIEEILGLDEGFGQSVVTGSDRGRVSSVMARELAQQDAVYRSRTTGMALQMIARHMANLPGRKNVIWLSAGFPLTPTISETMDAAQSAVQRLNDANVAVYPVDIRGLVPTPPPPALMFIADRTGGVATIWTNGLSSAIARAVADSEVTYTLGFYAESDAQDGRFHKLDVKVARKGVQVRAREGYYGFGFRKANTEQVRLKDLGEILGGPLNATQIRLTGSAQLSGTEANTYELTVTVDLADVSFQVEGGYRRGNLQLTARTDTSKSRAAALQSIPCTYTERQFQMLLLSGLKLKMSVPAEPSASRIQVAVQDANTGKIGSLWIPLK
jgi:VWFA-related protein